MGGAYVQVECAKTDTAADYATTGEIFQAPGWQTINIQGAYYIRGRVVNATATTSITLEAIQ